MNCFFHIIINDPIDICHEAAIKNILHINYIFDAILMDGNETFWAEQTRTMALRTGADET